MAVPAPGVLASSQTAILASLRVIMANDSMVQASRLAGLHSLRDHSVLLVSGASSGRVLAVTETVALPDSAACVGRHVGRRRADHGALARVCILYNQLAVGPSLASVQHWIVAVLTIGQDLQRPATGWLTGSDLTTRRAMPRDHRDSRASATPSLSRPSLRNAGVEYRNRTAGLLRIDSVRSSHRSGHDWHGRQRTPKAIRSAVSAIQSPSARCDAEVGEIKYYFNPVTRYASDVWEW